LRNRAPAAFSARQPEQRMHAPVYPTIGSLLSCWIENGHRLAGTIALRFDNLKAHANG
jgi:hypothetical protein